MANIHLIITFVLIINIFQFIVVIVINIISTKRKSVIKITLVSFIDCV